MRGRTNITQRTLPYVNGRVINAQVDIDNTINVGDFVEYKQVSNVQDNDFSVNNEKYINHTLFLNDYVLALQNQGGTAVTLDLWNKNTKRRINSISFPNSNLGSFTVSNNDNIIVWFNDKSDSDKITVKVLSYTNNTFVTLDTKIYSISSDLWDSSSSSNRYASSIVIIDDSHFALLTGTAQKVFVNVISFNDSTGIIGSVIANNKIESITLYVLDFKKIFCSINPSDGIIVVSFAGGTSGNLSVNNVLLIEFDLNYQIDSYVNESFTYYYDCSFAKLSNNSLVAAFSLTKGVGADYYPMALKVFMYDDINDNLSVYDVSLQQRSNSGDVNSLLVKNGVAYISSTFMSHGSIISRISFDESTKEIDVSNQINIKETDNYAQRFLIQIAFENSDYEMTGYNMENSSYRGSNNKVINLLYSSGDNELITPVSRDYVKQYNNGKAIGFAKTAGTAGDNIKIYIPN